MTYRLKFLASDHNLAHVHKDRWPDHDVYYYVARGDLTPTANTPKGLRLITETTPYPDKATAFTDKLDAERVLTEAGLPKNWEVEEVK